MPEAGAARAKIRATNPTSGTGLNALDPGTVGAARQAGISEAALEEMARLIWNKKSKAEELPLPEPVEEDLDEFGDPDGVLVDDLKDPMQQALIQLTKIDSGEPLEAAGKAGAGLSSRPGADCEFEFGTFLGDDSAEQRGCFEDPHQSFRRDPQGDLSGHRDANAQGFRSGSCCFVSWAVFRKGGKGARSRIGNYQNHIRWAWQVGGILDDLMADNPDRARARAALLLASADQASIDGGSWVVSTVALMEPLLPYQEFAKHTSPLPSENQSTALFDPRWSEVFLGTLRERESYNEAKKKLQGNKQGNNKNDDPPGNPPGGRKGKGKGDGGSGDKPDK